MSNNYILVVCYDATAKKIGFDLLVGHRGISIFDTPNSRNGSSHAGDVRNRLLDIDGLRNLRGTC